jgi:hypothetical protein
MNKNYFNEWRESVINTLKPDSHTLFAEEITTRMLVLNLIMYMVLSFFMLCIWHQMSDTSELGLGDIIGDSGPT